MSRAVTVRLADSEDREVRIRALYTPGTPDRGPDFGCAGGYPGDPEDIEVVEVEAIDEGALTSELLSEERWDDVCEAVREAANERDEGY